VITQNKINLDGIIHIRREKKGRKGKTVTTISGFNESTDDLKKIAKGLKNKCGTGGSAKGGVIIIQGDHRQTVQVYLAEHGFKAKLAGG
jgi:translation initiation factor 1